MSSSVIAGLLHSERIAVQLESHGHRRPRRKADDDDTHVDSFDGARRRRRKPVAVSPAHAAEPSSPTPAEALARSRTAMRGSWRVGRRRCRWTRRAETSCSRASTLSPRAVVRRLSRAAGARVQRRPRRSLRRCARPARSLTVPCSRASSTRSSTCTCRCCSSWGTSRAAPCRRRLNRTPDSLGPNLDYLVHAIEPAVARTADRARRRTHEGRHHGEHRAGDPRTR